MSLVVIIERLIKINKLKSKLIEKNSENEELVVNLESTVEERTLTIKDSFALIEEKEKNYGDLLAKSSEMIQMLDPEGRITYVNQAWLENMNFDKLDEVLGRPIVEFFNQNTLEEFQLIMPKLMNGELVEELECQFISKENKEIALKGRARPIFKNGSYNGSQAFFFNITEVLRAKREMDQMTSFKEIMLNITTEYINVPISQIDDVINASLLEISKFSSADRAYVFKYNFEKQVCSITHEWVGEGIPSQLQELKEMPFSKVPHSLNKHSKGEFVEFPDVSKIKDKRIFNVLNEEGTQSMISIPMMHNDDAIGFIGFDIMKTKRSFTADEKNLLWIYSQMLVNVFNRIAFIEELQTTKNELAEINLSLEKKVFENTKKNMDLSRSIMEQEKLVTIGEISAGIAHDLNTPLGTIRVGADNINFILNSLFNGTICDFTKDELSHILNHVEKNRIEMYVGGLQMRKEKAEMLEFLNASLSGKIPDALDDICDLLVKCRFDPSQEQEISMILSKPFAKEYLQIMNQLQMAMAQLETIRKSSDKAVGVVQDMRAFIKGESVVEQKTINLRDNISTVLGVFNYEISLHVNLVFEVDPSIEFMGYDIKLFQLWSNIVKNGLEAMSDQKDRYFGIFAERKERQLKVVFENNGPKIPEEIAETIFQKFYTTKSKKSGSGLGLSIVKNVLKEHKADIIVESSETLTKFIITFEI
jgi:PAS domain S-box-containing protein